MSLKVVSRHGSPALYLRGTIRGIRVDESTRTGDRRAAEEIRAKREAELLEQSIHGKRATATFAHAAASYLENGGDGRFLAPVIRHFGTTPLARIDQDALDAGAKKLYPNAGPATRNRHFFTPASAVLHHAARRGWCPKPTIERPAQPPGRIRFITPAEADKLIAASAAHLRPLVIFLLYTGARIGEALWLDWRNVDLDRAHVQFLKTKNGEPRGVPLHPRVVAALKGMKGREGAVFRRPDGAPYERSLDAWGADKTAGWRIRTAFRGAVRRASLSDFRPHDCRHTWATWHYQVNRDLGALQRLGGWKTMSMVMRYAHTNVAELDHTINRLPWGNFGEPKRSRRKKNAEPIPYAEPADALVRGRSGVRSSPPAPASSFAAFS
ncbi:MAG TPA: site-specific integrase [Hyphomicrobiales bacterium]|nr:site-specific integrase [Hyphomicrobiales bacterium]